MIQQSVNRRNNDFLYNNNNRQQGDDQQLNQFQDNYVFKTLPSFQMSESHSKQIQKSQNWFKTKQQDTITDNNRTIQQNTTCIQRKRRTNKNNKQPAYYQQINPQLFQQLQSNNIGHHNSNIVNQLKKQLTVMKDKSQMKQVENDKLRGYIEFLQDYNLKLKRQLMIAMRRRTIDDDEEMLLLSVRKDAMEQQIYKDAFQSRYVPKINATQNHPLLSTSYSNNNNNNATIYQYHNKLHPYPSAFTTKHVSHFYQLPQKQPYYLSSKYPKTNKNKKILPISLQASMIGRQNPLLQSSYEQSNYTQLNASIPTVQNVHTPEPQHYQYLNPSVKLNNFVCSKCSETHNLSKQQSNSNTKNTKPNKKKSISTSKYSKNNNNKHSQSFICHGHHNQSKRNKNSLPTRSRTLQQSSRKKQNNSKNTQNKISSKKKPLKYGQKIAISQFCI